MAFVYFLSDYSYERKEQKKLKSALAHQTPFPKKKIKKHYFLA